MSKNGVAEGKAFWACALILAATVVLVLLHVLGLVSFCFFVGLFCLNHWFVLTGTFYISFAVPVIVTLKRRYPNSFRSLLRLHMFGNLLAFALISVHFASQISRPAERYPDPGTGVTLYVATILLG